MSYSYNRLWKLLVDKRMTKIGMQKQADVSTNIPAKMGKDEPVATDAMAKIRVALDDIAKISSDTGEAAK